MMMFGVVTLGYLMVAGIFFLFACYREINEWCLNHPNYVGWSLIATGAFGCYLMMKNK